MRKLFAMVLSLLLLLAYPCAFAEETPGEMRVYNCDEWVSLRAAADKGSDRLAKVPLDALVTDCAAAGNGFTRCTYAGMEGYILTEYLTDAATADTAVLDRFMSEGREILNQAAGDYTIMARHSYSSTEQLRVICLDSAGDIVWERATSAEGGAMLDQLNAFMSGTAERPLVIIFNASLDERSDYVAALESDATKINNLPRALTAYDAATGEQVWTLSKAETGLDSGLVSATSEEGILYVGGYLGPDPIAIDPEGNILCRTDADNADIFWLYKIIPDSTGFTALYESGSDGEMSADNRYEVYYRLFGSKFDPRWPLDAANNRVTTVNYYNTYKNKRGTYEHSCQGSIFSALDVSVHSQPVYAVEDGVVDISKEVAWTSFGNYVRIKHTVYDEEGNEHHIYSLYAHMLDRNTKDENGNCVQLKVGDKVKKGQLVGTSGYSLNSGGKESWHLHFEIFDENKSGSIFNIYSGDDIQYESSCYAANQNHGEGNANSQTFTDYLDAHYTLSGGIYVRRTDDDNKPLSSFIDNLYKEGGEQDAVIAERITPETVEVVID